MSIKSYLKKFNEALTATKSAYIVSYDLIKEDMESTNRTFIPSLALDTFLSLVSTTLSYLRIVVLGFLINEISRGGDKNLMILYLVILVVLVFLDDSSDKFYRFKLKVLKTKEEMNFKLKVLEKFSRISITSRYEPEFIRLQNNDAGRHSNTLRSFFNLNMNLIVNLYQFILVALSLTLIDFRLLFISILAFIFPLVLDFVSEIRRYRNLLRSSNYSTQEDISNGNFKQSTPIEDNMITNKNFSFLLHKYKTILYKNSEVSLKEFKQTESLSYKADLFFNFLGALVVGYVYLQGVEGILELGTLTLVLASYNSLLNSLSRISSTLKNSVSSVNFLKDYRDFLRYTEAPQTKGLTQNENFVFEFKNVSFKYPNSEEYVLKKINLEIKKGDKLGIIGVNGAGKSTLIKLLYRAYRPEFGSILLNGQDVYDIKDEEYFSVIKKLEQDQKIESDLSVEEFIYLGNTSKPLDEKLIIWSAKMAEADLFIENLEHGYNTKVLSSEWDLHRLSEISDEPYHVFSPGQLKRLLLARIFYSKYPIIILDEPTSNVDPISAKNFYQNLDQLADNEILIIISHDVLRLNKIVNKVLILDNGEIIEYGNREDLINDQSSKYNQTLKSYNSKELSVEF